MLVQVRRRLHIELPFAPQTATAIALSAVMGVGLAVSFASDLVAAVVTVLGCTLAVFVTRVPEELDMVRQMLRRLRTGRDESGGIEPDVTATIDP